MPGRNVTSLWTKSETLLFPPLFEPRRALGIRQYLLILIGSTILFSSIGFVVKPDGFLGYDWYHFFSQGIDLPWYPPWTVFVQWLTWPLLVGLSCTGLVISLYQRYASPLVMGAAFFSLPVLWVLFLGQLDGLVLLGLTSLPWLTPLATLKPQISAFAFLADKRWLAALLVWILITMLIWGLWPVDMFNFGNHFSEFFDDAAQPQNISLWPWAIPLGLYLLWLSKGDMDLLLLAGTFVTPHVIPYSYIVVVPAIARVNQAVAIVLVAISWLPLSANWVGGWGWYLGHIFTIILWIVLFRRRNAQS